MSALIAGANEAANRLAEKFSKTDVLALLVILVTIGGSVGGLASTSGQLSGASMSGLDRWSNSSNPARDVPRQTALRSLPVSTSWSEQP